MELERGKAKCKELPKNFQRQEGWFYYKNRLYIADNDQPQTMIAKRCHDSTIVRHFKQEKRIQIITRDIYTKTLTAWINDYVQSCEQCQHNKLSRHTRYALLQPPQVPFTALTSLSKDFITHLGE